MITAFFQDPAVAAFLSHIIVQSVVIPVIIIAILLGFVMVSVMFLTWMERRVIGRIQARIGPNRVGPCGLFQPVADAVKLLTKEDVVPANADRFVFILAPALSFIPAFLIFAVIPFGERLVPVNLAVGLLYAFAVPTLSTLAIILAGWAANNKYALLGGLRSAAQMVSYSVPLVLSTVGVVLYTGSLSLVDIVEAQRNGVWFILLQPLGFVIYFIAALAELNRIPFDLPEAESELVAGFHTEYSGMKFAFFFLAEYTYLFATSAIASTLFLGGWSGPVLPPVVWFLLKTYGFIFVIMWLRATLPRVRADQLMGFAWKALLPLALINIFVTGLIKLMVG